MDFRRAFPGLIVALIAWLAGALACAAHEVRPALLQITEAAPGRYEVTWKQPLVGDAGVRLIPHLSGGALEGKPATESIQPGFLIRTWSLINPSPLDGQPVQSEGLAQSVTDVILRVSTVQGHTIDAVLQPASPSLILRLAAPGGIALPAYLVLGVRHILTGPDHLMFVLGLLLLSGIGWRIVKVISAFTVAHSITLALAALGYIHFPSAVIEALVALSIVFVAFELVPRPDAPPSLTRRFPWLIAFVFGLLHGMAFAGALAAIGLPARAAPQALLLFNLGVELGQLMFIAGTIGVIFALRWVRARVPLDTAMVARLAPAYAIGGCAMFWLFDRLAAAYA